MLSGLQSQKSVRARTKSVLALQTVDHEEAAIYEVNQRIPNDRRIAEAAQQGRNP